MFSTRHDNPEFQEVLPQREKRKPVPKTVLKPNAIVEYNHYMGVFDKPDQKSSSHFLDSVYN